MIFFTGTPHVYGCGDKCKDVQKMLVGKLVKDWGTRIYTLLSYPLDLKKLYVFSALGCFIVGWIGLDWMGISGLIVMWCL